jgi:hypothetical protein
MTRHEPEPFVPFRPTADDLESIAKDVAPVKDVQEQLHAHHAGLPLPDRVAHQYQIAGGKVILRIENALSADIDGVGLFEPGTEHMGLGRLSTGQGGPHHEAEPDFLGLMLAFQTRAGRRVDFISINSPTAPADDHHNFMKIIEASGEAAGARNLFEEQSEFGKALVKRQGVIEGARTLAHIGGQTTPTTFSSTAYQTYWTGVFGVGTTAAKFVFVPVRDENHRLSLSLGERHFTEEWRRRQAAGDVEFHVFWIPFLNEEETPLERLTKTWKEDHKEKVATLIFPQSDLTTEEAMLWAALTSEMGANHGNWVRDREGAPGEPTTEFGTARKIAYGISQAGRNALDPKSYAAVFATGRIDAELAAELKRRREEKERLGHVSWAPGT